MTSSEKPDVARLMTEIDAAAKKIEENPVERTRRTRRRTSPHVPPSPGLEENWDVWQLPPVTTHRGLKGMPVVLFKRAQLALLSLHNRELLKRQREYNRQLRDELYALKRSVAELAAEVAELRHSRT